jgi:hypothetical protein
VRLASVGDPAAEQGVTARDRARRHVEAVGRHHDNVGIGADHWKVACQCLVEHRLEIGRLPAQIDSCEENEVGILHLFDQRQPKTVGDGAVARLHPQQTARTKPAIERLIPIPQQAPGRLARRHHGVERAFEAHREQSRPIVGDALARVAKERDAGTLGAQPLQAGERAGIGRLSVMQHTPLALPYRRCRKRRVAYLSRP